MSMSIRAQLFFTVHSSHQLSHRIDKFVPPPPPQKRKGIGMINENFKLPIIRTKRWHFIALFAFALSLIIFIISLVILFCLQAIIEFNIRRDSVLTDGTIILDKWSNPQYFIRTNMFTYSVRNPDEVTQGEIPIVKRVGPYVFDQIQKRKIISRGNGSLKYETYQYYHFDEEASCSECFLHNRIWIPNLVYQKFVEAASKPSMKAAIAALVVQTPFLEVEVAELLFDGYADPFLDQVCSLPVVNFVCEQILDLPDRIGLFYKKNGTSSGIYEVEDGHRDGGESLGRIITWNNATKLPEFWWSSREATQINGTDGTLMPPYISKDERLSVFVAELCRSIDFVFQREVDYAGISLYRFIVPNDSWDWSFPWNKGFCHAESGKKFFEQQQPSCLPSGLLDVSRCQKGEPPIVVSLPNFLYAPDFVHQSIKGIRPPLQELDQIEIDIEPRLGTIMQAHRRFLINISMWKGVNLTMPYVDWGKWLYASGSDLAHFHSSIVPVLEVDEYIHIDDENLELIKSKLIFTEKAVTVASICGAIFSLLAIAVTIVYIFYRRRQSNTKSPTSYQPNMVLTTQNGTSNNIQSTF